MCTVKLAAPTHCKDRVCVAGKIPAPPQVFWPLVLKCWCRLCDVFTILDFEWRLLVSGGLVTLQYVVVCVTMNVTVFALSSLQIQWPHVQCEMMTEATDKFFTIQIQPHDNSKTKSLLGWWRDIGVCVDKVNATVTLWLASSTVLVKKLMWLELDLCCSSAVGTQEC